MGLDITAYSKLVPAPNAELDRDGYPVDWNSHFNAHKGVLAFTEENWPGRSGGIAPGVYTFGEALRFRAGSYGGYNAWRRDLTQLAGYASIDAVWSDAVTEGPFYELINFADNEGVIGAAVSAKLAKDFAEYAERAEAFPDLWFVASYQNWRKAFELAADGGCVDFH